MELVLACQHFASIGGTQTYLLTVAEQLQRLGHGVTILAEELGEMAELARARGVDVALLDDAPARVDGLITRDGVVAARLARELPGVPHLFVMPSEYFDFQRPPLVPGAVSAVIVLNDRLADRARALALDVPVRRLRHPVDIRRFAPRSPLRTPPRRALLLGNYTHGARKELIEGVCAELGIECVQVGAHGEPTTDPVPAIAAADIVFAKARAIVEAMACGRAAYVTDVFGTDGWVTPERYPLLEADNFAGRVDRDALTPERLRADLLAYRPAMGIANRELAVGHSAGRHAEALVEELLRAAPRPPAAPSALETCERLTRLLARAEGDAELARTQQQAIEAARDAWQERALLAEHRLDAFRATRRYRLATALTAPLDRLRRLSSKA